MKLTESLVGVGVVSGREGGMRAPGTPSPAQESQYRQLSSLALTR